jgi:hypothetical protein
MRYALRAMSFGVLLVVLSLSVAGMAEESGALVEGKYQTLCLGTVGPTGLVVGTSAGLAVYKLDGNGQPQAVGNLPLPNPVNELVVIDSFVLAANGSRGLVVLDLSALEAPEVVAELATPGDLVRLVGIGDVVYGAMGETGVAMLDVKDPRAPALIKTIPVDGKTRDICPGPRGIMVAAGTFAWVPRPESSFPQVDYTGIPDPSALAQLGSQFLVAVGNTVQKFDAQGFMGTGAQQFRFEDRPVDIQLRGQRVAIAAGTAGVALLERDLFALAEASRIATPDKAIRVHLDHDWLFVTMATKGFAIYNIKDPRKPKQVYPVAPSP